MLTGISHSAVSTKRRRLDTLGFEDEDLARLLAGAGETLDGMTDEDSVPEFLETPVSQSADLWILGNHRLCSDATVATDVQRLMGDDAADLVFTDPPYNVDYEGYTGQLLT
jgi:hypothetical protein